MIPRAMADGLESFVGRKDELGALRGGVTDASAGHGSVWVVSGEPGIGKSRLVEELARAAGDDVIVAWGRCWEEGGAPPYWPWTQVLRALLRKREIGSAPFASSERAAWIAQLVPELTERVAHEAPPALEPELARFRLLDAVVTGLGDVAEQRPLVIVLEDLHVADASSVELLAFLARQIRGHRIAVIATMREGEALRGENAAAIARVRRESRDVALSPLGRDAVAAYLATVLGERPAEALVDAMMATTEGNPLFLSEIARRSAGLATVVAEGRMPVIPATVQMAIRARVDELDGEARGLVSIASVLGREVDAGLLAEVSGASARALTTSLAEAVDRAILTEAAPSVFRFSHILVRETVHASLDAPRRAELHRRTAQALERRRSAPAQVAHHYLEAGEESREDAIRTLALAGRASLAGLAFVEAAGFFRRALALVEAAGGERARERGELLLDAASSLHHAGDLAAARSASDAAVEVARELGDPLLFARAALEHGAVFDVGAVNDRLIALLEEALDRLEPGDSTARARVMARLASARQPSIPTEHQFELARRAIAMARRMSDERALLDTLRNGVSALMDLADPRERLALNQEHASLAERLGEPLDVLLAHGRIVFDAAELGESGSVAASIDTMERIVDELGLEQHRWRVTLMRAMCATAEGRFDAADELGALAAREAEHAREGWASRSVVIQEWYRALLRGAFERALEIAERLSPMLQPIDFGRGVGQLVRASTLARAGRLDEAAALFSDEVAEWGLALGDLSMLEVCVDAALAGHRAEIAGRLLAHLRPNADRFVSWGIVGAAIGPPAGALAGRLLVALGEEREGEQLLREALARAKANGLLPHAGWIALEIARLSHVRDAEERAREALEIAERLGMPGLGSRAREVRVGRGDREDAPGDGAPVPTVAYFRMQREGGVWVFDCDGTTFHVKDVKGLHLLARLVDARGRELHVLDLDGAGELGQGGDAGEMIDDEARRAYAARVADLREELAEAERWNDGARASRAREELSAIESELARAVGLGGRARRAASHTERARINVQRRLKDAIRRIEAQHSELGKHLAWAVRTGTFCSYRATL